MNFYNFNEPVEKYKDYRNRTVDKFINRHKELLKGIKSSSLKPEDKMKLKITLIQIIQHDN